MSGRWTTGQRGPMLKYNGKSGTVFNIDKGNNKITELIFDIYVTVYGTALTTILPILFLYLNTVTVTAGTFEP
jgi:hypothetical protein